MLPSADSEFVTLAVRIAELGGVIAGVMVELASGPWISEGPATDGDVPSAMKQSRPRVHMDRQDEIGVLVPRCRTLKAMSAILYQKHLASARANHSISQQVRGLQHRWPRVLYMKARASSAVKMPDSSVCRPQRTSRG